MYHHPLASFFLFTASFMFFELIAALTLWALAALYTSSLTQPSLAVEDNYLGAGIGNSSDSDSTMRGGTRRTSRVRGGEEEETESLTVTEAESEGEGRDAQSESLASLQARDAQEQYEARRAEMLRNEAEGRRMTAVDPPSRGSGLEELDLLTQGRRVLGRLDEETEEETDIARSEGSIGWEDVGGETEQEIRGDGDENGLRRRRGDVGQERESTIGGASTSRASSSAPSFTFGGTTTGAPSSTAPSTVVSRSQTEATPEIKQEEEDSLDYSEPSEEAEE